ncbi:MAG: CDP-alcohol phosphatidyltransferase family protein [Chloroflexi bacterium]|nr:CDP-alcohol phosphatidyltransferase family protein [Chloroflexota bacterium]
MLLLVLLAVPLGGSHGLLAGASLCAFAGVTDAADGYVARRLGCVTHMGGQLDLIVDKLFVSAMVVYLAWLGVIPFWVPATIALREGAVSLARLSKFRSHPPAPDAWGKAKMATSLVAIVGLLLRHDLHQGGLLAKASAYIPLSSVLELAPWIMGLAVVLTVLSGANYLLSYGIPVSGGKAFLPWSNAVSSVGHQGVVGRAG